MRKELAAAFEVLVFDGAIQQIRGNLKQDQIRSTMEETAGDARDLMRIGTMNEPFAFESCWNILTRFRRFLRFSGGCDVVDRCQRPPLLTSLGPARPGRSSEVYRPWRRSVADLDEWVDRSRLQRLNRKMSNSMHWYFR